MTKKQLVEQFLGKAGLLYQKGKGGITAIEMDGGVLIQNLNSNGEPIQLGQKKIDALIKFFPKQKLGDLERRLVRNAETGRRITMLEERQRSGVLSLIESLDAQRPMPVLGTLGPGKAELIPRTYAGLDISNPNSPSISIWGSEFAPNKKIRLDEGMFVFDVDSDVVTRVKNGERLADILNGPVPLKIRNARILYFDDNKAIKGAKRLEHHLKSIASLEAWATHVFSNFKLELQGNLFLHVEDWFADSPGVLYDKIAEVFRKKKHRFFLCLDVKPVFINGKFQGLQADDTSKVVKLMRKFSGPDKQKVLKRMDDLLLQIEKAMAKVKMTPP